MSSSFFMVVFWIFFAYLFCMKKKEKKNRKKFVFAVISKMALISLLVGILIISPTISIVYFGRKEMMEEKMFGHKAAYQGVLTLWNVDTFEGGTASRSGFLEKVAVLFESKNKGVYIKVENLTVKEMLANIKMGKAPHLFSFGTGLAHYFEKDMLILKAEKYSDIKTNFLSSGMAGGNLKAVPWCCGGYFLFSTTEKIEKAGKEVNDLTSLAFDLSYDKVYKRATKHINSLTFGKNDYVDALEVFSRYFTDKSVVSLAKEGKVDPLYNVQSPYDAYVNFISTKSSMLLGTQRDLARLEARVMSGAEGDYLYEPLGNYTDLVSYISIIKNDETKILEVCNNFVEFLLSEKIQLKLKEIGLISSKKLSIYDEGAMKALENVITEQTIVKAAV